MSISRRDRELILRQIDGAAKASERHELEARLRHDVEVRRYYEAMQSVVDGIESLESVTPPLDVVGRAQATWRAEQSASVANKGGAALRLAVASAIAVTLVVAGLWTLRPTP